MLADLHTHTNASDGVLSPEQLFEQAKLAGINILSVTDHDTVAAYTSLQECSDHSIRIVPGIEFSSIWRKTGVHIVGLNIDLDCATLKSAIAEQRTARLQRAETIANKLSKLGFTDTLEGAKKVANGAILGRPHFARFLVESGQVKTISIAFKKFLGQGKPGDVKENWPALETVIGWITTAGGTAILAHPAKYKLSNLRLQELTKDFSDAGGHGLEVISGKQDEVITSRLGKLSQQHGLLASCGSDFHQPGQSWAELGNVKALPAGCTPVWESW
jgi:predicted metal-dependent phosphoesterase TrpH